MTQIDFPLPPDLPAPVNDGAATHLVGMMLPPLVLRDRQGVRDALGSARPPCSPVPVPDDRPSRRPAPWWMGPHPWSAGLHTGSMWLSW